MMTRSEIIVVVSLIVVGAFLLLISTQTNGESTNLHMNLKAGDVLAPETNGDPEANGEVLHVEADYQEGIIGRTNRQFVDVGTWTSDHVGSDFSIDDTVEFNIWFQVDESQYDAQPDWEFHFYHNDNEVFVASEDSSDESTEEPIEIIVVHPFDVDIDVQEGDTLSVYIRYRAWEDCDIYFDCAHYDSGVEVHSDFLTIFDLVAEEEDVVLELYDPFDTDWDEVKTYFELKIDNETIEDVPVVISEGKEQSVNGITVMSTYVTWDLDEPFKGGEDVEAWIKYTMIESSEDRGFRESCKGKTGESVHPVARIKSITPNPAEEGDEVTFNGKDSYDDDGSVARYVWYSDLDGELYNGSSGIFKLDGLSTGNHTITLRVRDDDDLWSEKDSEVLEVQLPPNTLPEITLIYPWNGALLLEPASAGEFQVEWEGYDADGDDLSYRVVTGNTSDLSGKSGSKTDETIITMMFVAPYGQETTFYWMVIVDDGRDEVESEVWSIVVKVGPVEILQIESHVDGQTVEGIVILQGHAGQSDDYIWEGEVDYVEVSIDGGQWLRATGQEEWEYIWDTTLGVRNGLHMISIRAYDGLHYSMTMTINVTVSNGDAGNGDDDDDFEIAGLNGFIVVGAFVACLVVVVVAIVFVRRNQAYDYEWDEEDEDGYYENGYDDEEYYQ